MKQAKTLLVVLMGVLAVSSALVASAFAASPTAKLLTGETFPVTIKGENTAAKTELQNAAGVLKGEGVTLTASLTSASAGTYGADFTKVKKGAEACKTAGDASETVLVPNTNTFTLVHDISSTTGVAALLNLSVITVECGATKIKIEGNVLALLLPVGKGGGTEEKTSGFEGVLRCSAAVGEPKEVKYWNAANEEKSALLLANFGTGFKKACEDVQPNLALTASKMIELVN